jgi:hypothetical protein
MFLAAPNYGLEFLAREFYSRPFQFLSVCSVANILSVSGYDFVV